MDVPAKRSSQSSGISLHTTTEPTPSEVMTGSYHFSFGMMLRLVWALRRTRWFLGWSGYRFGDPALGDGEIRERNQKIIRERYEANEPKRTSSPTKSSRVATKNKQSIIDITDLPYWMKWDEAERLLARTPIRFKGMIVLDNW